MRTWVDAEAFHAVAEQNIYQSIRMGTTLCVCCVTASSASASSAVDFVDTIDDLIVDCLRSSDSVGRIGPSELGIVLVGARRLDAFDVLRELGRVVEREGALDPVVRTHVGIAEIDPAYPAPSVSDLLDVARLDLQIPAVRWPERGNALVE
jgi:hypothetical protein